MARIRRNKRRTRSASATESLETRVLLLAATNIQVFHRSGQSFVTWQEDTSVGNERYHVYRHSQPITSANINQARKLTAKWGPLDDDTSIHKLATGAAPSRFVINDLGSPLSASKGLFVHTTLNSDSGTAYYAVTQVNGSSENKTIDPGENATTSGVGESVATPSPVLVALKNGGKGRLYTQFMDYSKWNPTFQGYAYNYSVALPANHTTSQSWPVKLVLHAYNGRLQYIDQSEFDWQAIQVFVDDPGLNTSSRPHTWWYGFASDHNYGNGNVPTSGRIENFTEQRVLAAIDSVLDDAAFNADGNRVHAQGFSMGATGALTLGVRYGNVFSSVFAASPMSDFGTDTNFQGEFRQLLGDKSRNLKVVNAGKRAGSLKQYNSGQAHPTNAWDWMDHTHLLEREPERNTAHLALFAGKDDNVIEYSTQARPLVRSLHETGMGFTGQLRGGWGHDWPGFTGVSHQMINGGQSLDLGIYEFRKNMSYPAVTRAANSGPTNPGGSGTDNYNLDIEWSVPWNSFHQNIVDTPGRYEVTIRSTSGTQSATVTPRRLQSFNVVPGATYQWENRAASNNALIASGNVTADGDGLIHLSQFSIRGGQGSRLILTGDGNSGGGGDGDAYISNNVLFVETSDQNDDVTITQNGGNTVVTIGGESENFNSGAFDRITVRTYAGADKVIVNSDKRTRVEAGSGNDSVKTRGGNDSLFGGSGRDTLRGEGGNDSVIGGDHNDLLYGGAGRDTLDGNQGSDRLVAGGSDDTLRGGAGNDNLNGGKGHDSINAASGNDRVDAGDGNDRIIGGPGDDILNGQRGHDFIQGDDHDDTISGGGENDTLYGGGGNDILQGSAGTDTLNGGGGHDILHGYTGVDSLNGGSGRDILIGGAAADLLIGSTADDILIGGLTSHDLSNSSLDLLRQEWTSGRSYTARRNNLRNGGGNNGSKRLNGSTISNDGNADDTLTGSGGRDWFFRELDTITDRQSNESLDTL